MFFPPNLPLIDTREQRQGSGGHRKEREAAGRVEEDREGMRMGEKEVNEVKNDKKALKENGKRQEETRRS